jgi:hypothetical protein
MSFRQLLLGLEFAIDGLSRPEQRPKGKYSPFCGQLLGEELKK